MAALAVPARTPVTHNTMAQFPVLLTFRLDDLAIAVSATDAFLVLDSPSSTALPSHEDAQNADSIVYRGRTIPFLDLRQCLELEAVDEDDDTVSLILEYEDDLVCLRVSQMGAFHACPAARTELVSDRFSGLARLLIAEKVHMPQGVFYKLDTQMAVRIAHQTISRSAGVFSQSKLVQNSSL